MSQSDNVEAWVVSAVFEHVRWRITVADVQGGSMSGAETVRDVAPHTITNDGRADVRYCISREPWGGCSFGSSYSTNGEDEDVVNLSQVTRPVSRAPTMRDRCSACWWRLQRSERGDARFGRSTAGSRLVLMRSAASRRLAGGVGLGCGRRA